MSFETEKESLSERRHQLRIDAREGARAAAVRQGCVPEGSHRPHEARALYPGGRSRAGPREVAARRAGVLSVIRGYRSIGHAGPFAPARETPSPCGRPVASDWPFAKQAYRARAKRLRQHAAPLSLIAYRFAGSRRDVDDVVVHSCSCGSIELAMRMTEFSPVASKAKGTGSRSRTRPYASWC